jgi:ribosomal protein S18 acetylase RimI-like enzyme
MLARMAFGFFWAALSMPFLVFAVFELRSGNSIAVISLILGIAACVPVGMIWGRLIFASVHMLSESQMTRSPIQLRPAQPRDLLDILEIEEASFLHAGERFERSRVAFLLKNPRLRVWVADDSSRVVGWTAGFSWHRGVVPWGRVYALAVHPLARGQRVGQQLLGRMIDILRQEGGRRIFLEVAVDNSPAIKLYERFGFVACRRLENYYGPGRAAQRMELKHPRAAAISPSPAASP